MAEDYMDRMPPQNISAEKAVLGSIFLDPDQFITVNEYIEPLSFYRRAHQLIFSVMQQLNDRQEAVDIETVQAELDRQNQLENINNLDGGDYIYKLAEGTPTAANAEYYAKIVEEKAMLRRLDRKSVV